MYVPRENALDASPDRLYQDRDGNNEEQILRNTMNDGHPFDAAGQSRREDWWAGHSVLLIRSQSSQNVHKDLVGGLS